MSTPPDFTLEKSDRGPAAIDSGFADTKSMKPPLGF
jgi:hypothetical protein